MILETFAATYIYLGAIAYLASDNPVQVTRAPTPTETAASAPPMHPTPEFKFPGSAQRGTTQSPRVSHGG